MEENEYNNVVNRQIVRDVVVDLLYFTRWMNQKELSKKSGRKVTWCTPTKDPHFRDCFYKVVEQVLVSDYS
jgi:hypothetical protein